MGQGEIDRLYPRLVFLAFAGVAKAADAVVGGELQLLFKRVHKGTEHVQEHALAMGLNDFENIHIDQGTENDRCLAVLRPCMVDLAHRLMGLVHRVNEG